MNRPPSTQESISVAPAGGVAAPKGGGWWSRFNRSRGVKKFRRNRVAMVALAIIGVYAAVAIWIASMEVVDWVGRRTGAWSIRESTVLSALLPYRAAERVGPPNLSGFGGRQEAKIRANQYNFLLEMVQTCVNAARTLAPDGDRTAGDVFEEQAMAERRVIDKPLAEVEAIAARARALFDEYDQFNRRVITAENVRIAASNIEKSIREMQAPDLDAASLAKAREDVAYGIEELGFTIEDEQAATGEESFFKDLDAGIFAEMSAKMLEDGEIPAELGAAVAEVPRAVSEGVASLEGPMQAKLDEIEAVIKEVLPMPRGFDGLVYRLRIALGTDRQGRSIFIRAVYSAKIALQVGAIAALVSVTIGTLIGAAAAYYGGWVDQSVMWVYSTLSSIPYLVLLSLLAFVFQSSDWVLPWDTSVKVANTLIPLYAAFCMTFWIGSCRVIRGEVMKLKQLEYVQAATALGLGRMRILVRHIVPNTMHLVFISFSLLLIGAIKAEVVLTFLGLGLKDGASWGLMISQARPEVVSGFFWQIGAATFFMFVLVLTFNIVSDALQDAFDPKHVG